MFQSTLSSRRATRFFCVLRRRHAVSIHALLAESDPSSCFTPSETATQFQSTLSSRRATGWGVRWNSGPPCFNPRSPRGERLALDALLLAKILFQSTLSSRRATQAVSLHLLLCGVSIHALLAESDRNPLRTPWFLVSVSIHALLAESDRHAHGHQALRRRFNPRSPRGERPASRCPMPTRAKFQSTLSSRRATRRPDIFHSRIQFQSTLSSRRATPRKMDLTDAQKVSIHALLAESDRFSRRMSAISRRFNPRSPRGERRHIPGQLVILTVFQSTLSSRRATGYVEDRAGQYSVSIHALLAESDGGDHTH